VVQTGIQAIVRSEFEDGLGSGDFVSGYSYHMSVRIGLPDHTMQTKFPSQSVIQFSGQDWDPWRVLESKLLGGRNLRMVWGRLTLCRATHIT
jgi:hypothetical protein